MNKIAVKSIKIYQERISKKFPNTCIYKETCSNYAIKQYKNNGFFTASKKSLKRLLSCNKKNRKPKRIDYIE